MDRKVLGLRHSLIVLILRDLEVSIVVFLTFGLFKMFSFKGKESCKWMHFLLLAISDFYCVILSVANKKVLVLRIIDLRDQFVPGLHI